MNFIEEIIESGSKENLRFRFPPEPNSAGLHLGHAKAMSVSFGLAEKYGAPCNLRMDDTNPLVESEENVAAIIRDVEWLGYDFDGDVKRASAYLPRLALFATELVSKGKAYFTTMSSEDIAAGKGTPTTPGTNSPDRDNSIDRNMELWNDFMGGKVKGVLRAKIDMTHTNMLMRDPVIFRWIDGHGPCPMYDFAHPLSDYLEGITHSLCTLEFEVHREFYDWVLDNLATNDRPRQIEFSRLNLSHAIMSKRKLNRLVDEGVVDGLDDPRLPTIAGLRARGYTPEVIREFCERVGVTKFNGISDYALLESLIREKLNKDASRLMVVMEPLLVELTNVYDPIDVVIDNNPEDKSAGKRELSIGHHIWIEKEDFRVEANRKYNRLKMDGVVRLKGGVVIKCVGFDTDVNGDPEKLYCEVVDSATKVKGTIHWADYDSRKVEVNDYDSLFLAKEPGKETGDFMDDLNPNSKKTYMARAENAAFDLEPGERVQFLRKGYFIRTRDGFNKIVGLRSSFKE